MSRARAWPRGASPGPRSRDELTDDVGQQTPRRKPVAPRWLQRVHAIWKHSDVRGCCRLVLLALAHHANNDGVCWPSVPRLERWSRLARSQVQRCLRQLEHQGAITVFRRGGGRGHPNWYTVASPETAAPCGPLTRTERAAASSKGPHLRTERAAPCGPNVQERSQERPLFADAPAARRRVAARKRARKTNPDHPPDPRVRLLLERFVAAHRQALGTAYLVRGGRDGTHLKRALATYDQATIARAIEAYFAEARARRTYGASVPLLVARIGTLASPRASIRPALPEHRPPVHRGPSEATLLGNILATITPRKES